MSISNEFGTKLGYEKSRADKAESELDRAYERYDQAEKDRNHWHDKAQEFKAQRDQSRRLFEGCRHERDFLTDSSLPRVITAEEVRNGQVVAARYGDERPTGRLEGQWVVDEVLESLGGLFVDQSYISRFDSIVLLADAVDTKAINGAKESVKGDYPDDPWFATVYERGTWRGTPITPQSVRRGDVYDIHTAHGSAITGILAARNGVHRPQSGDQYRLVNRAT